MTQTTHLDLARYDLALPEATYTLQAVPQYQGNPFIEALPPIRDEAEIVDAIQCQVTATDAQRALPSSVRRHFILGIRTYRQPLPRDIDVAFYIDVLLRQGYVARNPKDPRYLRMMMRHLDALSRELEHTAVKTYSPTPAGAVPVGCLIGQSGLGKSTTVEAVAESYEQVLTHSKLPGPLTAVNQIVWLKLTCPPDGTIKGLCVDFFAAVDRLVHTNYSRYYANKSATVDEMRVNMARVAYIHGLGVLIIDEIHHLSQAKSGGAEMMLNFFKVLANEMKVPVLAIGTPKALNYLGADFQNARRFCGLAPFKRFKADEVLFEFFCEGLFQAQYLRTPVELSSDLLAVLYNLSQGIPGVLVQLFTAAQTHALKMRTEELSADIFTATYDADFTLLHGHLDRVRRGLPLDELDDDFGLKMKGMWKKLDEETHNDAPYMLETSRQAPPPVSKSEPSIPVDETAQAAKPKKAKRKKGTPSPCLLVQLRDEAHDGERDFVAVLKEHQMVWDLGAETLALQ